MWHRRILSRERQREGMWGEGGGRRKEERREREGRERREGGREGGKEGDGNKKLKWSYIYVIYKRQPEMEQRKSV